METLPATFYSINNCTVLILPMRNGNLQLFLKAIQTHLRSYPTYEEWKHWISYFITDYVGFVLILPMRNGNFDAIINGVKSVISSYPTYEEWKLSPISSKEAPVFSSSYPTYEEWKPFTIDVVANVVSVFLSYLWGMETKRRNWKRCKRYIFVLILPMRNGNIFLSIPHSSNAFVLILPMRNGNKE